MDIDEFKQFLAAEGLHPDDTTLQQMFAALPHLEAMKTRVGRRFDDGDEPAHIFVMEPDQ
jgi:hypothetical protein